MARDDRWFRASCAFIVAAFVSYVVTLGLGVYLVPDVQNILGASFGLYPSPVGTAVGDAAGVGGLALVQALAVGAIAYLVAREAPPWRAVLGGLPVLWWLAPLGVHVLGVLLLVLGLVSQHHDSLGKNLRHDFAVGRYGQHVLPQLDGPLDEAVDGHVFAGAQRTLDDNAFADEGALPAGGWRADRRGVVGLGWRRSGTRRRRRTNGLISFPHRGQYTAGVLR